MNEDIVNYARQKYNLLIGLRMAERTKIEIGSAYPMERERTMILRGRNLVTGLPEAVEVSSVEIREALVRLGAGDYRLGEGHPGRDAAGVGG